MTCLLHVSAVYQQAAKAEDRLQCIINPTTTLALLYTEELAIECRAGNSWLIVPIDMLNPDSHNIAMLWALILSVASHTPPSHFLLLRPRRWTRNS